MRSLTFGRDVPAFLVLPMIVTGIKSPGSSLATLVARVTPSIIFSSSSEQRNTNISGIPVIELPKREICLANFKKSAPASRLSGKRRPAGLAMIVMGYAMFTPLKSSANVLADKLLP